MSSTRIPWWLWPVAASFIACFVVGFLYLPLKIPESHGISLDLVGKNRVDGVKPGSPGDAAGVKPGDIIVNFDGRAMRNAVELQSALSNATFDHPVPFVVLRGGQEVLLRLTLNRTLNQASTANEYLGFWVEVAASLIQLLVGLVVLFKRPRDLTAVAAGIFLCSLGTGTFVFMSPHAAVLWRSLPLAIQWLVFPTAILSINGFPFAPMLLFSLSFPKPLLRRWAWIIPAVLTVPLLGVFATTEYIVLFAPQHSLGAFPKWLGVIIALDLLIVFASSVVILAVNYFSFREVNERRRIRLVVFGLLLFLVNLILAGLFALSPKTSWVTKILMAPLVFGLVQVPFTLCVAYAVLKQRLFQVSFIVRQSLQYAVARGVLLIPIPILAGILIFDLIAHKNQPLAALLSAHGWAYALIGVIGIVAHTRQSRWMEVLDRRFYREHYDAQHLLRQTVDGIRASSNLAEVAPQAVAQIEQALHPEFVAIMMREANEPLYRCIASAPAEICPRGLSAESKLMAAFRLFAKPLQISLSESGWLKQQLPHEDTDFLRKARIDLMVPIAIAPHGREALMVLGPKKSEEPYSKEDQELLSGVGSALALLLERPVTNALGGFEECPRCGLCYESGMGRCASEGTQLTHMPFQRLLSSRYRLERKLGRGGMGTVYKATDTSLERAVAVKLIRDDLIASSEAADRFRREAKAAASFAHPNLVTVYDFGMDSETRVFLVMELLEGATLRQQLEQHKKFSPQRILQVLGGICAGLEAAHELGLVHRDLKPENIFLTQSGEGEVSKILDFGLAKFLLSPTKATAATVDSVPAEAVLNTASGFLVGTPQYMSPDQLNGEVVSPAWDIWALAVITYEMLAGAHPFPATSLGQMQYSIVNGRFTPLSTHLPNAPAEWQQFFERALNPDPAIRPHSAREFVSTLGKTLAVAAKSASESHSHS